MLDGTMHMTSKNSSKLNKFLHSEANLLIQHIIVQDQDGQNNNIRVLVYISLLLVMPRQVLNIHLAYDMYVLSSYHRSFILL